MALITAAEARPLLPALTGTGEDTLLDMLIAAAGSAIALYLGYPVPLSGDPTAESTSYTLFLDGPGGRDLVVPVWPLTAVASIYDDPALDYAAASLVASGDYAIADGRRGLVRLTSSSAHGSWSRAVEGIKITCTAGYSSVPTWLKHACRLTVRHWYDLRAVQGRTSQAVSGVSIGIVEATALPAEAEQILAPHRLPSTVLG